MNTIRFVIIILTLLSSYLPGYSQPGAAIEVNKPKKYENRRLASEKTGEKKFTLPRKFYQNTVTHYNYYFNANQRLNDVVTAAKIAHIDNYAQLLPFYNYTLETTSQNKQELDSIIYKCTAGILLHDLRNSWIDNLYLILGKAYFFRNDLDSAGLTLQYLNFSYAPKEEGGYDIPIGSNSSNEKGEFSIATKEKNSIWTKLTSRPPSRNESFIWQARTHIEKDELPEAAGIIEILRNDPNFPARLKTDLHEVLSYWFYKQQVYDSSANYLSKALNEATSGQEKARWEYLIAQMYQLSNKNEEAINYYNKSISHTTDPVMDVYARLNSIRIQRADKENYLQENIDALLKMAKRDKYENYRDIIYYAAANIELERNNFKNAQEDLLNSVKYTTNNPIQRSQSFLLLGDMNFNRKAYTDAYNFYDSLEINVLARAEDRDRVSYRKPALKIISENTLTVTTEDSLQALAKLPPDQRDVIIKKQEKLLRKAQGLKEEEEPGSVNLAVKQVPDLFADNSSKGNEFYFYNASTKARGFSEFKARWGERPNVDNWRRKSAIDRQTQQAGDVSDIPTTGNVNDQQKALDNSYEGLQSNIPLTQEKVDASNENIMQALFMLGQTFMGKLEEYPAAIQAYEELLRRFPNTKFKDEAIFNLIYAYQKTGDKIKSDQYKNQLLNTGGENKWTKLLKNPTVAKSEESASPATKKYEQIYSMFIEGNFDQAKNEKKIADSLYGKSYWTPQLLFIESIYYIKQQDDSTAIKVLTNLSALNAGEPLGERARTMIDVLKRRKDIEDYLTKLEVKRNIDVKTQTTDKPFVVTPKTQNNAPRSIDTTKVSTDTLNTTAVTSNKTNVIKSDTATVKADKPAIIPAAKDTTNSNANTVNIIPPATVATSVNTDTISTVPPVNNKVVITTDSTNIIAPGIDTTTVSADTLNMSAKKDAIIVDPDTTNNTTRSIDTITVNSDTATVLRPGNNATNSKIDTSNINTPPIVPEQPIKVKDSVITAPVVVLKNFSFVVTDSQYVVILLDKVDPVYQSEARNAFNRFNRERFYNQKIDINSVQLDERWNLILQGPFTDATTALSYVDQVRPVVRSRILPWLTADKYTFLLISNKNLNVLKNSKDMSGYKELLQKALPGKFD